MTENGSSLNVINPATEESIEEISISSRGDLDKAAERARGAFKEWRGIPGLERAELFHELASSLRDNADELAEIMTREGGKPFIENHDEVGWAASSFDYYAEIARDSVGYLPAPIEAQQLALVIKEPVGVVACLVPWNYPLLLAAWKVAPALAAGNAVILKPSEETPLATRRMMELMEDLPDGLFQTVYGAGEVGEGLVRHPGVDMVAFTGSQETGRKVGITAAERLMRANLELGGKDPFIVCDDVDIEIAAQGAVWAACLNVGQALSGGAKLVTGGERTGERGFFYRPTVLTGVEASMRVMSEETFGPVLPVVEVGSLEEAIELANSVPFGLGANVYTRDFERMLRCARGIRAGTVWINDPLTDNDAAPFGGYGGGGDRRGAGAPGPGGVPE